MRRWDGLVDGYLRDRETRGPAEAVNADLVVEYLRRRAHFHAKATVASTVASVMSHVRGMGEHPAAVDAGAEDGPAGALDALGAMGIFDAGAARALVATSATGTTADAPGNVWRSRA